VRYEEFRDRLEHALHDARLILRGVDRRVETIDIADMVRSCKIGILRTAHQRAEPFYISAEIGFEWGPLDAARAQTCEEDVLAELVGRRRRPIRTDRRWIRVNLLLRAKLPYGSTTAMPEPDMFGAWTASVVESADVAFTEVEEKKGHIVAILGGHGDLEVQARCNPDGVPSLTGLEISGFRLIAIPRVWDDPERVKGEKDPGADLRRLAQRYKTARDNWAESVSQLATWIRYSPPPAKTKPIGPWFGPEFEEDDDGGGPITH
jgi:hypothetical protein